MSHSSRERRIRGIGVLVVIIAATLLSRGPFLDPIDPGWDESTFILLGQSIVDGNLPYNQLWDLKPPLAFGVFALPIALFGKSLAAIRVLGLLCVAASALMVHRIGSRVGGSRIGLVAALLLVFTVGAIPDGQQVMTEHLAIVPLTAALWVAIGKNQTAASFWWIGLLLGFACLLRLNLAYAALLVGPVLLALNVRSPLDAARKAAAYAMGGGTPVLLSLIPYLLTGASDVWWRSVFLAPLAYSEAQLSLIGALVQQVQNGFGFQQGMKYSNTLLFVGLLIWCGGAVGLAWMLCSRKHRLDSERTAPLLLVTFAIGTAVSIGMSGAAHPHYLIQLVPFFAIGSAYALDRLFDWRYRLLAGGAVLALAALGFRTVPQALYRTGVDLISERLAASGTGQRIAEYISDRNPLGKPVYLLTDQIAYWYLGAVPPDKAVTHPSNITKDYLLRFATGDEDATPESVMTGILGQKPEFVVTEDRLWYLRGTTVEAILQKCLNQNYRLVRDIDGRKIYRLISAN